MTLLPLDFDFPLMTAPVDRGSDGPGGKPPLILSHRLPWQVPEADMRIEIAREIEHRRGWYPELVRKGRMTEIEMHGHIELLDEIHCDLVDPFRERTLTNRWEAKVRELRREIAIRRNGYPKSIEKGRLRERDAGPWLEAIEGVHFTYWIRLEHWDERGPATSLSASMEPIRRQSSRVEAWLWQAHLAGDPAIAGYLTPQQIAWHQAQDQQERQAA